MAETEGKKVGDPEGVQVTECPQDLAWARRVTRLYPKGWSPKLDALRECLERKAVETEATVETHGTE